MEKTTSLELAQKCGAYLASCCADTNADTMKLKLENVHDEKGNILGDYEIRVKKIK